MRVGIIAYNYPPYNSIGALRPAGWAQYLPEFDIEPVIVTRHWDRKIAQSCDHVKPSKSKKITEEKEGDATVVRAPFIPNLRDHMILRMGLDHLAAPRKVLSLLYSMLEMITFSGDHHAPIYTAALEYFHKNPCDVLVATGGPFVLFRYADLLSRQLNVPWIADYRDGWTTSQELRHASLFRRMLNGSYFRLAERKHLRTAALITTAAPSYAEPLRKLHSNTPVEIVFNGFDDDEVSRLESSMDLKKRGNITSCRSKKGGRLLSIIYGGTLYRHQPLELFLSGLELFLIKQPNAFVDLKFIGTGYYEEARARIDNYKSIPRCSLRCTQRVDYASFLKELASAHLLLLLSRRDSEWLYAKIFDYLAARRRILLVPRDNGVLSEIIDKTRAGDFADTPPEIAQVLSKAFEELLQHGEVSCNSKGWERFGRRTQTKKMATLLQGVASTNRKEKASLHHTFQD